MKREDDYEYMAFKRLQAIDKEVDERFQGAFLSKKQQSLFQQIFKKSHHEFGEVEIEIRVKKLPKSVQEMEKDGRKILNAQQLLTQTITPHLNSLLKQLKASK